VSGWWAQLVHHRSERRRRSRRAHLLVRIFYEHRASREVEKSGSLDPHLARPAMLEHKAGRREWVRRQQVEESKQSQKL
jgi:hypothetical protein